MFGISFNDQLEKCQKKLFSRKISDLDSTELIPAIKENDASFQLSPWKVFGIKFILLVFALTLLARAISLQLIKGSYYRVLAEENRIISRPLAAPRGIITDSFGNVLVRNSPYILDNQDNRLIPYQEFADKISTDSAKIKQNLEIVSVREYSQNESTSHVLGYVSAISEEELKINNKISTTEKKRYSAYDVIGRTGLEEQYEEILKGTDGNEFVEIDSSGKVQRVVNIIKPKSGNILKTSLNLELQKFSYLKLSETVKKSNAPSGVVIVQRPQTGEILTLTSYPSYDNNIFTHQNKREDVQQVLENKNFPLLNRAVSGAFPPGSTYKMITALAGLQSNTIKPESVYEDTGNISVSGITFNNWYFTQYGKVDGIVDVRKAIQRSNDTFFYKLALALGPEKIAEMSHKFRMGELQGLDIPGEVKGLIPTPQWKQQIFKQTWFPGNTINMSIGQGDVLTTPLQITSMTSAIANGGKLQVPKLAIEVQDANGLPICTKNLEKDEWRGNICQNFNDNKLKSVKLDIEPHALKAVQEGMRLVTKEGGTASTFFKFAIETAGKTGTAETQEGQKPNAWYTGYAPYKNPKITVTVLVEKGGEGSAVAAPVAKEIIEFYLNRWPN